METDSCIRFLQVLLLTCRIIKFLWKNRQSQRIMSTAISTAGYVVICERDKLKVILKHDARSKLRSGLLSHLTHLKFQVMNKLYPTLYKSENIKKFCRSFLFHRIKRYPACPLQNRIIAIPQAERTKGPRPRQMRNTQYLKTQVNRIALFYPRKSATFFIQTH